jgi:colicin import membrane protein
MQGMAGASGDENAKGSALKSSGPSASYAGRIRARIKPNITFTEDIAGNPKAEVEVRTSPDGTILSRKLLSSSGNKSWDEAVLKAIDKTAILPRDEDGRVPPVLEISFRPKD